MPSPLMSSAYKRAILLSMLTGIALPAMAGDDGHGDQERRGHSSTRDGDRHVNVPGWQLPANRVLPAVGYTARPLAGDEPAYGDFRRPARRWMRGVHYSDAGYAQTYVVRDYRGHGLRPPPPGYYWRGDGRGTYLLVDIATGIVARVVGRGG